MTLTQVTPASGAVCPGQDLVYSCNSTVSTNVVWSVTRGNDGSVFSQATNAMDHPPGSSFTLDHFIIQVVQRTFQVKFILSTATLENTLFYHNNTKIDCFSVNVNPALYDNAIVLISGEFVSAIMYSTCVAALLKVSQLVHSTLMLLHKMIDQFYYPGHHQTVTAHSHMLSIVLAMAVNTEPTLHH